MPTVDKKVSVGGTQKASRVCVQLSGVSKKNKWGFAPGRGAYPKLLSRRDLNRTNGIAGRHQNR